MKAWLAIGCVLASGQVMAGKTVAVTPPNVDDVRDLDEVIVQGDRTLSAARKAIIDAENRFYARWNLLNTDDQYDIKCYQYIPTGTHFSYRICEPRFVEESTVAETQRLLDVANRGAGTFQSGVVEPLIMLRMAELKKRTVAMVEKDPELKRALLERARLAEHFEALRQEKFRHRWIVWD